MDIPGKKEQNMRVRKAGQQILKVIFLKYLKLLERTITIQWEEDTQYGSSQIFGFWHEDSFFMNLVLKNLADRTTPVDVIVTADTRGEYIEYMIEQSKGHALRVPDGFGAFKELKKILRQSYEQTRSLAIALDGPLGPRHEPKKLAFYLSEHAQEEFVGISISYSACIRLKHRWDKYAVPLPFTKVKVLVRDYGIVPKDRIPELPVDAQMPKCDILVKEF